jgi:N6-adenosine-specific RNA methylase IME4
MNFNPIIILSLSFLIVIFMINLTLRYNIRCVEEHLLLDLLTTCKSYHGGNQIILILNYESEQFNTLDELLQIPIHNHFHILFKAPGWLYKIKQKLWTSHTVIPFNTLYDPLLSKNNRIFRVKKGKITEKISETIQFVETFQSR